MLPGGEGLLQLESRGRVRVLTLDRPKALNAFNDELYDALASALRNAAQDPDVAVVVLTGSGRAFTAGQDLGELSPENARAEDYVDPGAETDFKPESAPGECAM